MTLFMQDTFTSTGVAKIINLPGGADYFTTFNQTQAATTQGTGVGFKFEWYRGQTAAGAALEWFKANSTNAVNMNLVTTGGFTYVTSSPVIEAANTNAITSITAASPAVVSQTNTYNNGDIIQFYGTTGMLQISGMNFQISSASSSAYTLTGLPAVGFAAAATAGTTRRISKFLAVDPQFLYVTAITKANPAVVTCSVDPTQYYVNGMKVHMSVPSSFGMIEMNGLTGTITAMSATNYTITLDIDSTNFTTFAFPTSASSPTSALFATLAPAGAKTYVDSTNTQVGYNFQYQPFRTGQFVPYMLLAAGVQSPAGATSDVITWQAWRKQT